MWLRRAATRLTEFSDRVLFAPTDVTSEADVRAAIAAGEERFGPLRGVVACAGVLHAERVLGANGVASLEAFRRVIDVNLNGTFNTVRLAAEAIARSEPQEDGLRGVVVMTSSVSAFEGQIGQAAYSASKGGVASLTLPLARELGQHGIRVVSIAPGVFDTPMMQAAPDKVRQSLDRSDPVSAPAWATPRNSRRWCATSSRTTCSTAASCDWTARFAWGRSRHAPASYMRLAAAAATTDRRWRACPADTFRRGAANRR